MTTSQLQRINELSKSIEVRKKEEENEILNEYFKIYKNYKDAPFNEIKIYKFYQTKKIPLLTKIIPVLVLFSFFIELPIFFTGLLFGIFISSVFFCNMNFRELDMFGTEFRFRLSRTINFKNFKFCEPNCNIFALSKSELYFIDLVLSSKFPSPSQIEKEIVKKLNKIEQKLLKEADFDDVIEIYKKEEEI